MPEYTGHPWKPSPPPKRPSAPAPARAAANDESGPERHWWQRKRWWAVIVALILLGGIAATYMAWRELEQRREIVEAERARLAAYIAQQEAAFGTLSTLNAGELSALRRSGNARHVEFGQQLGVTPIPRRDQVADRVSGLGLVRIDRTPYYWVSRLTHSHPYVTRDAAVVLDTVGVRFHDRLARHDLPPFQFNVTSVLRTREDQARLRGVNINAAQGTSSHEFGTTFDLHYRRFRYGGDPRAEIELALGPLPYGFLYDEFASELRAFYDRMAEQYPTLIGAVLGRVMIELENEGHLISIRERLQPVYHTTVARRLAE